MKNKKIMQFLLSFLIVIWFSPYSFSTVSRKEIEVKLNSVSIPFIENRGQISKEVKFYAKTFGGTVFITGDGNIIYSLSEFSKEKKVTKGVVIKESFSEEKVIRNIKGEEKSITKVNIFKGKDSKKWLKNIPTFERINLGEIHKGIEVKVKAYGNNVEKIFYVKAGANPSDIKVEVKGAKEIEINKNGELILKTSPGEIKFTKPVAYQEINGKRKYVNVSYKILSKNTYTFKTGKYNKTKTLIIDPLLASTFLGGNNFDEGMEIELDSNGNVFIVGRTYSSDFPTTEGAYDPTYNGGGKADAFISKFNSDLSSLLASTFLGGSDYDEGWAIEIDTNGDVFITGWTNSNNFPTTEDAYDTSHNGNYDVFISKFNSDLSNLIASTYLGGTYSEEGYSMALDTSGNVFVTGWTESTFFPTTEDAYDTSHNGNYDVFISKFNSDLSNLIASTFLGESNYEEGTAIVVDSNGNVFVTGRTKSTGFPTTEGAYDTSYNGGDYDAFISKLNNTLTSLLASTFLGGDEEEYSRSIALDTNGNVFVTGMTQSENFPATEGAYDTSYNGGNYDVFISKLNYTLTSLLASTYLGGSEEEDSRSIALDTNGNVFITGRVYSYSLDFPTTTGAYDTSYNGGIFDIFVSKLNSDLTQLFSSTFLGGSGEENSRSIVLDTNGNVFITGRTKSTDYPTTEGAYDTSFNTNSDVVISKLDNDLSADQQKGDINGNGEVDISDVILCLRMAIGLDPVNPEIADMDNDGTVNISDVILVLRKAIGLD